MGCETAWNILQSAGLHRYYDNAEPSQRPVVAKALAEWAALDHPDFLKTTTIVGLNEFHSLVREHSFSIYGIHCLACLWLLENISKLNSHVIESRLLSDQQTLRLRWVDGPHHLSRIAYDLSRVGYTLSPAEELRSRRQASRSEWLRIGITGALAAAVMHLGLYFLGAWDGGDLSTTHSTMSHPIAQMLGWISALLTLPVITYGAWPFYRSAYFALRFRKLSADWLISVALIIGFVASLWESLQGSIHVYYDSLSMIVFLLLVGRKIIQGSRDYFLKPLIFEAKKIDGNKRQAVPASSLVGGDRIEVAPGEFVPTSCRLESNEAWCDISSITGEAQPQRFVEGQTLPEGAIACSTTIIAKVLQRSTLSTTWSAAVFNFDQRRLSHHEQWFVMSIMVVAFLGFWIQGSQVAIAILIVACPCALALSEPLVLESLRRQSAAKGILVGALSKLWNFVPPTSFVFDKTGTLTQGHLEVSNQAELVDKLGPSELDRLYSMCVRSEHPLSKSLAFALKDRGAQYKDYDIHEVAGTGLRSDGYELTQGEVSASEVSSLFKNNGINILQIRYDDFLRPEAPEALRQLVDLGYSIKLFSGDRTASTNGFLRKHGLQFSDVRSELRPQEKAQHLENSDAFVGDGLNDREAMKHAALSIGITGSAESNLKTADIYLQKKDLRLIPEWMVAMQRAQKTIRLNITLSIFYNIVAISLVFMDAIGPIVCAIIMPLSSLSVYLLSQKKCYFDDAIPPTIG